MAASATVIGLLMPLERAAAGGTLEVTNFDCGYDATANTLWPTAIVHRVAEGSDPSTSQRYGVSALFRLFDGATQVAQLSSGEKGSGSNGVVKVTVGSSREFRPEGGVVFGDDSGGDLTRDHDYTFNVRMFDFDGDGSYQFYTSPTCRTAPSTIDECDGILRDEVIGDPPSYKTSTALSRFKNDDHACEGSWVPTLDDDFVPQGIARDGADTYISGYTYKRKGFKKVEHCRLIVSSPGIGNRIYDFPKSDVEAIADDAFKKPACKHGGGVALDSGSGGYLWVADTKFLFALDPALIGTSNPIVRIWSLDGLNGSFLVEDFSNDFLWIGHWMETKKSKLYKFSVGDLTVAGRVSVHVDSDDPVMKVPAKAQGGALYGGGMLIASSNTKCGALSEVGITSGNAPVVATHWFGPGVEEIFFDADRLVATFEVGTKRYGNKFFPLVATFDWSGIVDARDDLPPAKVC